ncbi:glycosyltransferase [soil metagenome]
MTRYFKASMRTMRLLFDRTPTIIFAQNPSIVLAAMIVIYGKQRGRVAVIDAHNAALERLEDANVLGFVSRWLVRHAFLTLVSNAALATLVEAKGGRAAVLPDPLPKFSPRPIVSLRGSYNVLFICTWAADEPYEAVLEAARGLPEDIHIYVTGSSRGRECSIEGGVPDNVSLTGFVPEDAFEDLLHSVDLVVDLTTREDCLVCGAYEGVAAGTPLLLSDTQALREYFDSGTLFTDNSRDDISRRIVEARARHEELRMEILELSGRIPQRWADHLRAVEELLEAKTSG